MKDENKKIDPYYKSILTHTGKEKLAELIVGGGKLVITHFAVGDGEKPPKPTQTKLQNEQFRDKIQDIYRYGGELSSRINIDCHIPREVGGFFVSELGIFDKDGDLIAISSLPKTEKNTIHEGIDREMLYKVIMEVGNVENVNLIIDSSLIYVPRKEYEEDLADIYGKIGDLYDTKAEKTDVQAKYNDLNRRKADKSYVDSEVSSLDSQISSLKRNKADKSYVNREISRLENMIDGGEGGGGGGGEYPPPIDPDPPVGGNEADYSIKARKEGEFDMYDESGKTEKVSLPYPLTDREGFFFLYLDFRDVNHVHTGKAYKFDLRNSIVYSQQYHYGRNGTYFEGNEIKTKFQIIGKVFDAHFAPTGEWTGNGWNPKFVINNDNITFKGTSGEVKYSLLYMR